MNRVVPLLGAAGLALAAAGFLSGSARAQGTLTPRVFQIDKLKCTELLSGTDERANRILIYFNGYVDGMRRLTTWDERQAGEMIDRVLGLCKADPDGTILSAFTRAAR